LGRRYVSLSPATFLQCTLARSAKPTSPHFIVGIGDDIIATLRVGSGTLADRYIVDEDGTPDVARSREYVVLVDDIRRRAKRMS